MIRGAMVISCNNNLGTLYMMSDDKYTATTFKLSLSSKLWYCRLGHMSEKWMNVLANSGKLSWLKTIDLDMYNECIFKNQKKVSF